MQGGVKPLWVGSTCTKGVGWEVLACSWISIAKYMKNVSIYLNKTVENVKIKIGSHSITICSRATNAIDEVYVL